MTATLPVVALIPARGGSKRIPHKNIRLFNGVPVIAHSIAAAKASGLFDRIVVSTDDEEIMAVAQAHGAEVPFRRPPALADDHATTLEVIQHAITMLHLSPQALCCCIYATAPLLSVEDLRATYQQLKDRPDRAFAFPVTVYPFPIQRALRKLADGSVEARQPEYYQTRSQDLEPCYHDAGQFYWGRVQAWLDGVSVYSAASIALEIPHYRVQDIDTPADWARAEYLQRALQDAPEIFR